MLRTFLGPDYQQFYRQAFDLAVAHLRLARTSKPPEDPNTALPLTTLSQALIVVFREAFPLARGQETKSPQSLDATGIQLDNAYLSRADLKQVWMPHAFLRKANLREANLRKAVLNGANLIEANLNEAYLIGVNLREADLRQANFSRANLRGADLIGASLEGTNLEEALSLDGTNLRGVKGLTKELLEYYKAQGALIDEDSITSPSQSPVSPPPPSQRNDVPGQSTPPAQSIPRPDPSSNSAASSQPGS